MKKTLYLGIGFLVIFIFAQAGTACQIYFAGDYGIQYPCDKDVDNDGYCEEFTVRFDPTTDPDCSYSVYVVFKDYAGKEVGRSDLLPISGNNPSYFYVKLLAENFALSAPEYVTIWMSLHPRGDVNSDGTISLQDTLLFLKGMTAIAAPGSMNPGADANDDSKLNMEDAIYTLQILSGLKEPVALELQEINAPVDTP